MFDPALFGAGPEGQAAGQAVWEQFLNLPNNSRASRWRMTHPRLPTINTIDGIPFLATIESMVNNHVNANQPVDTSLYNIILAALPKALEMCLQLFNFNHGDTVTPNGDQILRGSSVSVTIGTEAWNSMPMDNQDGEPIDRPITSKYIYIKNNAGIGTITSLAERIALDLAYKHLVDRDINQPANDSRFRCIIASRPKSNILLQFSFAMRKLVNHSWEGWSKPKNINWVVQALNLVREAFDLDVRLRGANVVRQAGNLYGRGRNFNRTRGQGGANMVNQVQGETSIINKIKGKLYVRKNLGDFFAYSKACISVPSGPKMCFPMAFMRCQLRKWVYDVDASTGTSKQPVNFTRIIEGKTFDIKVDDKTGFGTVSYSFYDAKNGVIKVFDNTKKKREDGFFLNEAQDLSQEEIDCWTKCSEQVHYFVQSNIGCEFSPNDFPLCLNYYAEVFMVNINVFSLELRGARIGCRSTGYVSQDIESVDFIGLLLNEEHISAISHIREFYSSGPKGQARLFHSYCDFCNTNSNRRGGDFKHQVTCSETNWWVYKTIEDQELGYIVEQDQKHLFNDVKEKDRFQEVCTVCAGLAVKCTCPNPIIKTLVVVQCNVCTDIVSKCYWNNHVCYFKPKKLLEPIKNENIFVYDIESLQAYDQVVDQYIHECILVCLRAVYDDRRWSFINIKEFVKFLLDNEFMWGSVILAHNGGGYDNLFVVRYLEDNNIAHSTIPRPGTIHKYLSVDIVIDTKNKFNIKFLDFMMMMTDSLKNIGKAFKLNVCKGDFPHNFSSDDHVNYIGPLPPTNHENDYYNFKTIKNQEELDEIREFWDAQALVYCSCKIEDFVDLAGICGKCSKKAWVFKEQLLEYCWKDVDVLAGACKAYRDEALAFNGNSGYSWEAKGIDPFNYMTQSQIALAMFTIGFQGQKIAITHEKIRPSFSYKQILWMEDLMAKNPLLKIQHAGNSNKEYFEVGTRTFVDGFCHNTKGYFEFLKCFEDGCTKCYAREIRENEMHPTRGVKWKTLSHNTLDRCVMIQTNKVGSSVTIIWEHDFDEIYKPGYFTPFQIEQANIMKLREYFYGGRTEVFCAYANPTLLPNTELLHHDVCSEYPFVCSWRELPSGNCQPIFGTSIDRDRLNPNHPDKYFGFAKIKVKPNTEDLIAVLPHRSLDGKLMYDLHEKVGCWHTETIYLAMEHGYEILEIYEVRHWGPDERTDKLMRGYMEFFLSMKQQSEGWEKLGKELYPAEVLKSPTIEQQNKIADHIMAMNGGFARPNIEKVEKNPVKRQLAKIFLNCLWGKLCQKNATELERTIYGYNQYLDLVNCVKINQETLRFRHVSDFIFKVRYSLLDKMTETNKFLNVPVAASVTAHAQILLMRQMFKVGPENVLYCDTDSIMFLREKGLEKLNKSGLGNWEDEHPNEELTRFWALAPKAYMLESKCDSVVEHHFKCKGVRSTENNRKNTKYDRIHALIESSVIAKKDPVEVIADTMVIHPNSTNSDISYGLLCTRYGKKKISTVYTKRCLEKVENDLVQSLDQLAIVRLVPFGYTGEFNHV